MACVGRFSLRLCSIAYSTKFNKVLELKSPVFHIFNKYDSRNLSVSITLKNVSSPLVVYPPTFPESVTEGDIQWQKNVGDFVKEDELIGEIETDKTSLPVRSPSSGKILEFFIENGAKVTKGDKLLTLTLISTPIFLEESSIPVKVINNEVGSGNFFSNSPSSAALTKSHEAITESTVKPSVLPPSFKINIDEQISRKENRVKIPKIRQTIANRLKESQNTYAMLTTFNEIDMSNFIELRQKYQNDFLKVHGIKLGFMSAFICAASSALQNMPVVNSVIDKNEIVYRDYIDISVAVATQKGLVVPVLRDVQKMNYAHVETLLSQLSDKAKKNQLALEDMDGGTFTISNGGVFGSLMGTPIINPPQSAVLGMHAIVDRPVAISGKVEIRPMMYVALTYDHRLIDGREAVTFLKKIKSYVEDSRLIIMGL